MVIKLVLAPTEVKNLKNRTPPGTSTVEGAYLSKKKYIII